MDRIAVYTSIFGTYDGLIPQRKFKGVDYICFTDQPFVSNSWQIVHVKAEERDLVRDNRKIKILAHRYLEGYDKSIYIDGNFILRSNPLDFIKKQGNDWKMMVFDHNQSGDARNCVYKELDAIEALGILTGRYKDDPEIMTNQVERYKREGYPEDNGLICGGVLIRKHNDLKVKKLMEDWWSELCTGSRRDQLSFNYVSWKNRFEFKTISGDARRNDVFYMLSSKHRRSYFGKLIEFRIKDFFGLIR